MAQDITWAGAVLTEADIIAKLMHEDGAWRTYTPTLTQSATPTKTVNYAAYAQAARSIEGSAYLNVTGAGTAGNAVVVGLPVAASSATARIIGSGFIHDQSASIIYGGFLVINTTTTAIMYRDGSNLVALGVAGFGAALANLDVVAYDFKYESA